jgi:hypothetical protein
MTIDNDSRAIIPVTLAETMELYSCSKNLTAEHLLVLAAAVKESHAAFMKAARTGNWDAMLGAATRMHNYTAKLSQFTEVQATRK